MHEKFTLPFATYIYVAYKKIENEIPNLIMLTPYIQKYKLEIRSKKTIASFLKTPFIATNIKKRYRNESEKIQSLTSNNKIL